MLNSKISLKMILLTLLGLGVAGGAVGAAVIALGLVSTSARPPHYPITTSLLHTVFKRSVSARADTPPPADFADAGRVKLGAQHYENVCSKCHGGPGLGQNPIALSMRPRPQHLPAVVDQFTDSELFVILQNGVRFSAMPAWPTTENQDEIWSIVAFLRELPDMDGATYANMVKPIQDVPQMPYGVPGELATSNVGIKADPIEEYLYAAPATEWADIALGGLPVARCAACHGADGSGSATDGRAPNLTLQSAGYISNALQAYATGARASGIMQVVASGLSDQQITQLGQYYENLPDVVLPTLGQQDAALMNQGAQIAMFGKPQVAVAACLDCHQRTRVPSGLNVPNIAGQNAIYLNSQLAAFKAGERQAVGLYNPMQHEAGGLDADEMKAVSAYFATLDPATEASLPPLGPQVDPANGKQIAEMVCSKCHEPNSAGVESGEYPNLTVHSAEYLQQQLLSFRSDQRKNERMLQVARRIEEQDIIDVAAYLGNGMTLPSLGNVNPIQARNGQTIAENGLADVGVPACLTCHSAAQTKEMPLIARLQGQNVNYLRNRLDYFARESSLPLPGLNPMHRFAKALTEDQRADVAAWFATQEALPK